jgi:hypothetical protein
MKSLILNSDNTKIKKSKISKKNSTIIASRHKPAYNASSLNYAVERTIKDKEFLDNAVETIKPVKFPAYKRDIINYLNKTNNEDKDIISLFETLDGYILYNDLYHVRKSIEQNIPEKKLEYQISDQKRRNLDVRTRKTKSNKSVKEREAVNKSEERKDYPEVTPTAMSLFICKLCGKNFQNQDDLEHHKHFERQIKKEDKTEKMGISKGAEKQQEKKKPEIQIQTEHEPRAITMAKALKEKRKRKQQEQDKDKAIEEKAVIEELESQGNLKEDVPVGGEEFESEEPRQGP